MHNNNQSNKNYTIIIDITNKNTLWGNSKNKQLTKATNTTNIQ